MRDEVIDGPKPAIRTGHGEYRLVRNLVGPEGYNRQLYTVQYRNGDNPWEDVGTRADRAEAHELYASKVGGVAFKVDGKVVEASDLRASVYLDEGHVMEVVSTPEGTIVDFFRPNLDTGGYLAGGEPDREHIGGTAGTYQDAWDSYMEARSWPAREGF